MSSNPRYPDLTAPRPDEVVVPLPRPMTPLRWARRAAWWVGILGLYLVVRRYDVELMRWQYAAIGKNLGNSLKDLVVNLRVFGQMLTLFTAIIIVAFHDRRRWWFIYCLLAAQALAMAGYNIPKVLIARYRPVAANEHFGAAVADDHIPDFTGFTEADTWLGWRPGNMNSRLQSFPSGHSAAAIAFTTVLAWFYPRLAWWWWCLGIGCALSRYIDAVHWLSDCIAGGVVGYTAAWMALRPYAWVLPIIWYRRRVKRRQAAARKASTA